ncbi:PP2C family protein-serine/threonine phosphatase [Corynebacterium lujinxingii]|uniref:Serine/threonine-protein phosphatase n=1 Tax=Corynebacterium lujinxingii TaxID=2763010 RepID=A0A7H0JYZ7_9CORY|nr:protein phosphatase 2C domain-containing protein [Corynebacterium lujinxingii]MBC3179244.1 serine/threonine-protein phosphatase [Corynebacterium lujinxingii]NNO10120.1 protein phosphatase [Corynebacterium lujinxingii]QNP90263.1 serine/threonine-protein phosphatase [Corynebacterium lujinxingii]
MKLALDFVAASDRGLVRGNNEDSAYAGPHLLVLADGMGGHAAGEVASQLMVEHLEHLDRDPEDADMLALLGAAAEDANASIAESVAQHPEQAGMGTTLTATMFNGRQFGLIHVGDSRGYLLRDGKLTQLTVDDTFVQSLVDDGKLAPEDVSTHPQKSLILKAYTGREVEPHLELIEAKPGDRILLCSDGLSDPVTRETIQVALGDGTPEMAAQRLIELALRSGGPDNVTVVVAEVVEAADGTAAPATRAAVKAGALVPAGEDSHPDSSASRAAALLRKSETITPDYNRAKTQEANSADEDEESHTPAKAKQPGTVWPWVVVTLVLLLVLVVGGAMWAKDRTVDEYALTVNEANEFVVEHTSRSNPFAELETEALQHACLSEKGDLRVIAANSTPDDCHVFNVGDLPEDQRASLSDDTFTGSYDDVLGRLNELADDALPGCVDKQTPEDNKCREVE